MQMQAITCQYVRVTVRGRVARVQLDRPPVNALNQDLVAELTEVARFLRHTDSMWVVELCAAGKVFCAGADLKERAGLSDSRVSGFIQKIQRMIAAWIDVPQPVVAGLQGSAMGGGLELALAADIIVAADNIRLGLPEVTLGIIPAAGGTQRLAQRATPGTAGKWILSGARFSAAEALRDGVVDYIFPGESFAGGFEHVVSQVASCAPLALRQAKKALAANRRTVFLRGLKTEAECYAALIDTEDRTEGLRAFAEKRMPVWRGQ